MTHVIRAATPGGIADELGITPGDTLLSMNGQLVQDALDFRFFSAEEKLLLEVAKPDGEVWELDIEKDADEPLGLGFDTALMSETRRCKNRCVFCFVDQMPPGLRDTLYLKDDDPRLSFLLGNYTTLTNMTMAEARRVARYHLSPLHISVHAADPDTRARMMGPGAGNAESALFDYLRLFNDAGITLHFQIVLCKGVNDGAGLDETIEALAALRPGAASLSVVPVGLTCHRAGLTPLVPFAAWEAAQVVRQVEGWQRRYRRERGTAFVFCADEWYLLAGLPLPAYKCYEGFPQLENGVGMTALFERDFLREIKKRGAFTPRERTAVVTGQAAAGFMRKLVAPLSVGVHAITNDFFGATVTVSGLLTGRDVIAQLKGRADAEVLFLPRNAFKADEDIMLDGTTPGQLSEALNARVEIGSADGGAFARQLAGTE